jgi:hypothetical protein
MQFRGMTPLEAAEAEAEWDDWCNRTRGRPLLRDVALRFTNTFEQQAGFWPSMKQLAPQALQDAGGPLLTPAQMREVVLILRRVWTYGLSFGIWAKRRGLIRPQD